MKKIIDISKWNVIKNYNELKLAGVDGAIVKAINSANSPDGRFAEHCAGLRLANIPIISAYDYLYCNTVAKATAVAPIFFKMCKNQGIKMAHIDIEDACMTNIGSDMAKIINVFIVYADMYDIELGIYTGQYFYNSYIKPYKNKIDSDLPIWIARYPSATKEYKVTDAVPSTSWLPIGLDIDGWQYTSKCRIPKACDGYLDLSVWFNDKPFRNSNESVSVDHNPFTEPTLNVKLGCTNGNDINWVKWNLWKQGFYCINNVPMDINQVCNGIYTKDDVEKVKMSQKALGLESDGIVGKITRATWKKMC